MDTPEPICEDCGWSVSSHCRWDDCHCELEHHEPVIRSVRCRSGASVCQPAVVRVKLSDGCLAYPDDREQDLCVQHLFSIVPRGEMELVTVYQRDVLEWYKQIIKK